MSKQRDALRIARFPYSLPILGFLNIIILSLHNPSLSNLIRASISGFVPEIIFIFSVFPKGFLLIYLWRYVNHSPRIARRARTFAIFCWCSWMGISMIYLWTEYGRKESFEVITADSIITAILLIAILLTLSPQQENRVSKR